MLRYHDRVIIISKLLNLVQFPHEHMFSNNLKIDSCKSYVFILQCTKACLLNLGISIANSRRQIEFVLAKLQARENNEERNRGQREVQRENSEENQYVDKVCFLLKFLNMFVH